MKYEIVVGSFGKVFGSRSQLEAERYYKVLVKEAKEKSERRRATPQTPDRRVIAVAWRKVGFLAKAKGHEQGGKSDLLRELESVKKSGVRISKAEVSLRPYPSSD